MKRQFAILILGFGLYVGTINAQNLNSNQEKGVFFAKCYSMAVHVLVNDSDLSEPNARAIELKKRVQKWAMNASGAAEKLISKSQFETVAMKELNVLATTSDSNYLRKQVTLCTSVLGSW